VANPQPEPFVQFSKELYRAILLAPFGAAQQAVVLAVILKTYGDYGKTSAALSVGLIARLIGRDKAQVSRSLSVLVAEGVVKRLSAGRDDHTAQRLALNKNYEKWGRFSVSKTVVVESTVDEDTTVDTSTTQPLTPAQRNGCGEVNGTVDSSTTTEDIETIDTSSTPPIVPPADPFDDLWSLLPKSHGNKQTTRKRFKALPKREQERCLAAARTLRSYLDAGGSMEFIPLNENFVGGSKARYTMWVDGVPAQYAGRQRTASRDLSPEDLFAMADMAEAEDVPESDCEVIP